MFVFQWCRTMLRNMLHDEASRSSFMIIDLKSEIISKTLMNLHLLFVGPSLNVSYNGWRVIERNV